MQILEAKLPKVIGICGRKNTGKNTLADILTLEFGYTQLSFARPLRDVCKLVFGLSDEEMNDRELKEQPLTRWPFLSPRKILQLTGTELFRNHFPGVWIERLKVAVQRSKNARFVVTDVRFQDEADAIWELGGEVLRIVRPGFEESDGHLSETELSTIKPDAVVLNQGGLEQLKIALNSALQQLTTD